MIFSKKSFGPSVVEGLAIEFLPGFQPEILFKVQKRQSTINKAVYLLLSAKLN